jgi:hypothetical protein
MPTRRPIANGYLDEVFAPTHGEEAVVEGDTFGAPRRAARAHPRGRARTRRQKQPSQAARGREAHQRGGTFALERRQVHFLDSLVENLRVAGVRNVDLQQVTRVLIDAVIEARIDWSRIDSIEAVRRTVRRRLRGPSVLDLPQSILDTSLSLLNPLTNGLINLIRDRSRTGRY